METETRNQVADQRKPRKGPAVREGATTAKKKAPRGVIPNGQGSAKRKRGNAKDQRYMVRR